MSKILVAASLALPGSSSPAPCTLEFFQEAPGAACAAPALPDSPGPWSALAPGLVPLQASVADPDALAAAVAAGTTTVSQSGSTITVADSAGNVLATASLPSGGGQVDPVTQLQQQVAQLPTDTPAKQDAVNQINAGISAVQAGIDAYKQASQ